jgi:transcriptional regulator GlxA family with amidase domain
MPRRPPATRRRTPRVTVLALPTVVPFDLSVPIQVFGYPHPERGVPLYDIVVCGARRGRVRTARGLDVMVPRGIEALRRADTIVVPGIDDTSQAIAPAVLGELRAAHCRGARIVSICTGAFVLAEAGLLDNRRATTHWIDVPEFVARFPLVHVEPDMLYVDEGNILTSAGIAAGIDLCLHILRMDHGATVANATARRLVVPPHRDGGQAQFVPRPVTEQAGRRLEPTRDWMMRRLAEPLTIRRMAEHAGVSDRTFARQFVSETGTSPLQWLLRQRLAAAQQLLEQTDRGVDWIADRCGLGSAVSLRVHFRRVLHTTPTSYRQAFRSRTA